MFTLWHAILLLTLLLSTTVGVKAIRRFRKRQPFSLLAKVSLGTACVLLSFLVYLSCYFYLRWTNRLVVRGFSGNAYLCESAVNNPNMLAEEPLKRARGSIFHLAFVVELNLLTQGFPLWRTPFALVPPRAYGYGCFRLCSDPNHAAEIRKRWPFLAPLQFNYAMRNCHRYEQTLSFGCDRIRELYLKLLQDNEFPRGNVILDGVAFDRRTVEAGKSILANGGSGEINPGCGVHAEGLQPNWISVEAG